MLQFLGVIEQRVQEMAQLYKIKHGIAIQGGIVSDSAPPTPLSKRRHRPGASPRLPGTGEGLLDDSEDDDEDGNGGGARPVAIAQIRQRAKARLAAANQRQPMAGMGPL